MPDSVAVGVLLITSTEEHVSVKVQHCTLQTNLTSTVYNTAACLPSWL